MILIFKIISLSVSIALIIIGLTILLPHKLSKAVQNKILKCGLIHLTSKEAADKIIENGVIKASKNKRTYFFQNEAIFQDFIEHNNLENKRVGIVISNLTTEQIKEFKIRYFDLSLIKVGDFHFLSENSISVDTSPKKLLSCSNMKFYLYIGIILLFLGLFTAFIMIILLTAQKLQI